MARRSEITIFTVWQEHVFRADFVGRRRVLHQLSHAVLAPDTTLAEAVLLPPSRYQAGRQTLVMSSQLWMQVISLPAAGVEGLADEELESAVRYEIESLCGIEADHSSIGVRELGRVSGEARYQVVAARRNEFEALVKTLTGEGAVRVELCHPAGANQTLGSQAGLAAGAQVVSAEGTERQIQIWPGLVALVENGAVRATSVAATDLQRWAQDFGMDPESVNSLIPRALNAGEQSAHQALAAQGAVQLLEPAGENDGILELTDPRWSQLRSWLERVAKNFEQALGPGSNSPQKGAAGGWQPVAVKGGIGRRGDCRLLLALELARQPAKSGGAGISGAQATRAGKAGERQSAGDGRRKAKTAR